MASHLKLFKVVVFSVLFPQRLEQELSSLFAYFIWDLFPKQYKES
jgi:hypothetical protein